MGQTAVSDFYLMTRAAYAKLSTPVAKVALRAGLTPDSITIIGTAGTVIAALTLYPNGAVFCGLLWWAVFGMHSTSLAVALMICLVTSQVISYVKARAEASGLSGEGGLIERPERLVIILNSAGLSGVSFLHIPWLFQVGTWVLAVASLITLGQRVHTVRTSPGAMEPLQSAQTDAAQGDEP
jgi:phosphatidylinositol phosphate synthase